ncbi:MAG: alpha/beta hydrolase [Opitutaceae bacterium]|nr:alpha/beta hydrolase [Verrucomicrobiales bacterium]
MGRVSTLERKAIPRLIAAFLCVTLIMTTAQAIHGKIVFEGPMESSVAGRRFIRVYLPPSYETAKDKRYPVLYVHDGQNAFTTVGTNVAFGWGNWALDKTADELIAAGRMRETILVAVDCTAQRYQDYRGPSAATNNAAYETYKRFLIEELKPRIDRDYRTLADAPNTGVLGSSMGGICSLALAWERPDVFGRAASLSGAFQVERRHFINEILKNYQDKPKPVRVYLDSGVVDFSGGDDGRKNSEVVAAELRRIGWKDGLDLLHYVDAKPLTEAELETTGLRRDKWKEAQTSQHNEFYWRIRSWRALTFMFPPIRD